MRLQWAKKLVHIGVIFSWWTGYALGNKAKPLETLYEKAYILIFVCANIINSFLVSQLVQTLQSSRVTEPVFLLTLLLPKSHHITWLNPKYHVTWPSTIYGTPSVQLHLKPMCLVIHGEISLLCSKRVNLAIRRPLRWMSATLLSQGLTPMSVTLPPGSMVGTRTGTHENITKSFEKTGTWPIDCLHITPEMTAA